MARLAVITHQLDHFAAYDDSGALISWFMLYDVCKRLEAMGHQWDVVSGPLAVAADAAILHVDCTVVPPEYVALGRHYRRTINFGTGDISKRAISRLLVTPDSDWSGPVIAKNDRNCRGQPERVHNIRAERLGLAAFHDPDTELDSYPVFDRLADVPDVIWADPTLVVERFVPEPDPQGYAMRTWVFMGERERCNRLVTPSAMGKAREIVSRAPVEVPDTIRAERARLGFDFGKFDFVVHDGEAILLDANRTPGNAMSIRTQLEAGAQNLAEGLAGLMTGQD